MDKRGLGSASPLLSQGELQSFCRLYQIPASVHPRLPCPGDEVSACSDRVTIFIQSLRDWKLRFFFVNNNFLPARLPLRDMRNPIVDEAPPLRDCDVPLFRLLIENSMQ
ncbi:hypothetical protein R6Q57_030031 [Mikania cordata]